MEGFKGFREGFGGLFGEKEAVLPWLDDVLAAAGFVGDDWAAGSKGFNCSDTEWFEAGENVGGGGLEVLRELFSVEPRNKMNKRGGESLEMMMFRAVTNDD